MIPSRGLARACVRLATLRQSTPRAIASGSRHFGTSLRGHGPSPRPAPVGLLSAGRVGAAILSSHSLRLSDRRFASTGSPAPPSSPSPAPAPSIDGPDLSSIDDSLFSAPAAPDGVGYLHSLGLDFGWGPTSLCQWMLEHLHFGYALPWWGAIVGVAVVARVVMFYPTLVAQKASLQRQDLRGDPVYALLQQEYMAAIASGRTAPGELVQIKLQMRHLEGLAGVGPMWHMALPLLQIPYAYGMFFLTRAMCQLPVPGLETAGVLWFTDLTVPDPWCILPCVSTVMMFLQMKRNMLNPGMPQPAWMKKLPYIIGPLSVAITLFFPAGTQLFIASVAFLQYGQVRLMQAPAARAVLGLPPLTPIDDSAPPPPNPFANWPPRAPGYQPPRTISTTATENRPAPRAAAGTEEPKTKTQTSSTSTSTSSKNPFSSLFRKAKASLTKAAEPAVKQVDARAAEEKRQREEREIRQQETEEYQKRVQKVIRAKEKQAKRWRK